MNLEKFEIFESFVSLILFTFQSYSFQELIN